jgi:hypothetical protein
MSFVSGLPEKGSTAAELVALKEVHHARKLIDKALHEWWAPETSDRINDAAEALRLAAWRLGSSDEAA